ncbi:MAG: Lipopolysaccharide core heptosyltransferase RfaQ [Candidatus Anoxychlamydiales bacterium]|nr:Lipopolysaccharide core heptosyltransferase RfaQ [Candidatus Anoxychlamydiales bacterium]
MSYQDYIDKNKVKKILIIKCRHLGDTLLTTPVFYNLKKELKNVTIDAFVYKDSLEILKNNPYIDNILTYDRNIKKLSIFKKLKKEFEIIKKIRNEGYDLIINLTEGDRGAIYSLFSKARYKVGIDPKNSGFYKKRSIYTHLVKVPKGPRHSIEKNLDAIRRIGFFPKLEDRKPIFVISERAKKKSLQILENYKLEDNKYILIHPTSRWRFKCYNKFDKLIEALLKKNEKVVVVSGKDPYEIKMVDNIIKNKDVINLAGKVSIEELCYLIDKSKVFYSIDSMSFHLANTIDAKVIALFGPSSEINWGPYLNKNATVITKNLPCRPCNLDGCGGSKKSDCLDQIEIEDILH